MSAEPNTALPIRSLALLSGAAFASAAGLRLADPLLPQIGEEFSSGLPEAAVVATGYTVAYGLGQIVYGPLGDRVGKVLVITLACVASALCTAAAAFAGSLDMLGLSRLLGGAVAGAIIPLCMAHIGDIVPYDRRQPVLARFLTGQMLGVIAGQSLGGVLGEHLGWRSAFLALAATYALTGILLLLDWRSSRGTAAPIRATGGLKVLAAAYLGMARSPRVRLVVGVTFIEGMLFFGGFAFLGAHLRWAYALDYDIIGLILGAFGIGALVYAGLAARLIAVLGQPGLALAGGALLALGFAAAAVGPSAAAFALVMVVLGLGFYMLHNTLQTLGTQMAPQARGIGMSIFAGSLFLGQALGVWLGGYLIVWTGAPAVFAAVGVALLLLAALFARALRRAG